MKFSIREYLCVLFVMLLAACGGGSGGGDDEQVVAPTITTQPVEVFVDVGQQATFQVQATGGGTLAYQWYRNDQSINGANSASFVTTAATRGDNETTYHVAVSNSAGIVLSSKVKLKINPPPIITQQPTGASVEIGQSFTFTVVATSTATIHYQWKRNGIDIVGATSSNYTLNNVSDADRGAKFSVVLFSVNGDTTSQEAQLILPRGIIFVGGVGGIGHTDGPVSVARIGAISSMFVAGNGDVVFADGSSQTVRKFDANYNFSTITGRMWSMSFTDFLRDGSRETARLYTPRALTIKGDYVYLADRYAVRRIDSGGNVETFVGKAYSGSQDGDNNMALFRSIYGLVKDTQGNLYVADTGNFAIRKISSSGVVTTLAGSLGISGDVDGIGSSARFGLLRSMVIDNNDVIYVIDGSAVRKVTLDGNVSTIAGQVYTTGSVDGIATSALFNTPMSITVANGGVVYIGDSGNRLLRKLASDGTVTTIAGSAGVAGTVDGQGAEARFGGMNSLVVRNNKLLLADGSLLREITPEGVVTTVAGMRSMSGFADGIGRAAKFSGSQQGIDRDSQGNLYVADTGNRVIRKITPNGVVTTIAGSAGQKGYADGIGEQARLDSPDGIHVAANGVIYFTEYIKSTVRKIDLNGQVTTIAGSPDEQGVADGPAASARFSYIDDLTSDSAGNLYIVDSGNHTIRKMTTDGFISTLAGDPGFPGYTNGTGSFAQFSNPTAITIDPNGVLYVTDSDNNAIRKVTPSGVVTTLAGASTTDGYEDGSSFAAKFNMPVAITIDDNGDLYVGDMYNHSIRRITPQGITSTVFGLPDVGGVLLDRDPPTLKQPMDLKILKFGDEKCLMITDEQAVLKYCLSN